MPRKPTGRPRGRPPGSGQLGDEGTGHKRLTVRLPSALYDALEAVAEREHYTRDAPELARIVRTALEHYLTCPHRRQTGIVPHTNLAHDGQTENGLDTLEDYTRQTIIVPELEPTAEAPRGKKRQTAKVPAIAENNKRQTAIPPQAGPTPQKPRGAMRQRILTLLGEYPEGLSAEEFRVYLKPQKPLGDTLQGMVRQHVLTKQGSGNTVRYLAVAEQAKDTRERRRGRATKGTL
jgi:predicted transcriptional regulator